MPIDPSILNQEEKKTDDLSEIKELLVKNYALTAELHEMTQSIKRYITFQKVLSLFYFLLIVVPIIISLIYLPPLLSKVFGQYQDLLGGSSTETVENLLKSGQVNINNLTPQVQELLKQAGNK